MTTYFVDNQADLAGEAEAAFRAAASAAPVFADINRFGEPSATHMVWQPTTTGFHPSFV